jgi:hypothetical protein
MFCQACAIIYLGDNIQINSLLSPNIQQNTAAGQIPGIQERSCRVGGAARDVFPGSRKLFAKIPSTREERARINCKRRTAKRAIVKQGSTQERGRDESERASLKLSSDYEQFWEPRPPAMAKMGGLLADRKRKQILFSIIF